MPLHELKKERNIITIIIFLILLTLPLEFEIYHMELYYIVIIAIMLLAIYRSLKMDSYEMKFYWKWEKKRKKGRFINILFEGIKSICNIVIVVLVIQFIAEGRTPIYIISHLPINTIIPLVIFLTILGAICGVLAWRDNERRYERVSSSTEEKVL
ncbi:MAG: hypothetical protein GX958_06145 [Desulfitobacterium sp.]|nr:hypothetical protein [Desulfitobacterium sp.]